MAYGQNLEHVLFAATSQLALCLVDTDCSFSRLSLLVLVV